MIFMFWRKYFIKKVVVIAFIVVLAVSTAFLIKNIYRIRGREEAKISMHEIYRETINLYPEKHTSIEWTIEFSMGESINTIGVKVSYEGLLEEKSDLELEFNKQIGEFDLRFLSYNLKFKDRELLSNRSISKTFVWKGRKLKITLYYPLIGIKTVKYIFSNEAPYISIQIIGKGNDEYMFLKRFGFPFSNLPKVLQKRIREKISQTSILKEMFGEDLNKTIINIYYDIVEDNIVIERLEIIPVDKQPYHIVIDLKEKWSIPVSEFELLKKSTEEIGLPSFKLVKEWDIAKIRENINRTMQIIMEDKVLGKVVEKLLIEKFVATYKYVDGEINLGDLEISMSSNLMRIKADIDLLKWEVNFIDIYLRE